jgi:urease accessory protein
MIRRSALAPVLALPGLAWAHHFMENELPRTFAQGFLSGLGHPIVGLDHFAFIVAAGFFLALVPRGLWGIAALIVGSLAGAALHLAGVDIPGGEAAVALSVIIIGAVLIGRYRIEFRWVMAALAIAAILHGHAYAESIFGAEPAPLAAYLAGFSLIQLAIASTAFFLHRHLPPQTAIVLGSVVGAVGLVFLVGA